ncbi:hypothetical protein BK809_0006046 [Diplodia seriata]|uniref:Ubiquitin supergroup n=1 Tax=Diplodia seriata TaxID=420778 RepID=A0A1S8BQ71_9PEZI|nr:hypothetical protein BK809_0006046 [Diplodia seriata]
MTELSFAKQFLTALEARPARLSSDHVVDPKSYPAQPAFILPRMPQPKRKPTTTRTTTDAAAAADQPTTTAETTTTATETDLVTVTLKPTRPTPTLPTYTLPTPVSPATTSMHDLKAAYAASTGGDLSTSKIKVLYAKKPVSDTKTIKEVLGTATTTAGGGAVEFSIMVLGGGGGGGGATGTTPTSTGTPAISTPPERLASPPVAAPSQPEIEMGEAPPVGSDTPEEGGAAAIAQTDGFWADLKGFLVQRLKDEAEGERLAGVFREAWARQ